MLLVLIPAFALVISGDLKRQSSARQQARAKALEAAKLAAATQVHYVKQTTQLLRTIAQFDFLVGATNRSFCEMNFSNLKLLSPDYSDFGLVERDGTVFCHTHGATVTNNIIPPRFALEALRLDGGVLTQLHRDPDGTNFSLAFACAIPKTNGRPRRVIYAMLKLPLLSQALEDITLPSGGVINVLDRSGQVLARYPDDERMIARELLRSEFAQKALASGGAGTFEARGLDKRERVYAVASAKEGGRPVCFVAVGIPRELTFAEADRELFTDLCAMILVACAVLAAAWWFSNRTFLRPVEAMVSAAEKIAAGDLSARTGMTGGGRNELYKLARRLDEMAESLQKRRRELEEAHALIQKANTELEARVQARTLELEERTRELQNLNTELEAFSYSVSHDLRAPLRHMDGFAQILSSEPSIQSEPRAQRYLSLIIKAAKQMGTLIDDLLSFSRMGRQSIAMSNFDSDYLVRQVIAELAPEQSGREVVWHIDSLPEVRGDQAMLRLAWSNLISNALKYTRGKNPAEIWIHAEETSDEIIFSIKDNGAGFDMAYADKLFGVFQRLHRESEFEGTGIGLANVRRIVHRHGGRTWAESEPGKGAKFFFSLPRVLNKKDRQYGEFEGNPVG